MLLDIIIPQYKEDENKVKRLLDSIKKQKHIDFNQINITIVNDASNVILSDEFINSFNLPIKYIKCDINKGPGVARQVGIDNTNADFIMFIDADDCLVDDENILYVLFGCMTERNPDLIVTNIVNEKLLDGKYYYLIKRYEDSFPWLHGKVYKREMLNRYNIRFHDNLRCQEDQYFTTCILVNIDFNEIIYLDFNTYIWSHNEDSITRKNKKYDFTVYIIDDFFNCVVYTYDFLNRTNNRLKNDYVIKGIFGIYTELNSNLFDDLELKEKKNKYLSKLKSFIYDIKDVYLEYKIDDINDLYKAELDSLRKRSDYTNIHKNLDDFITEYEIKTK